MYLLYAQKQMFLREALRYLILVMDESEGMVSVCRIAGSSPLSDNFTICRSHCDLP